MEAQSQEADLIKIHLWWGIFLFCICFYFSSSVLQHLCQNTILVSKQILNFTPIFNSEKSRKLLVLLVLVVWDLQDTGKVLLT